MPGEHGPLPNPARRRRNKRPPASGTLRVARPTMPASLPPEAKAEWRRIVPELEAMGHLAKIDRAALVRYCTLWADWVALNDDIARTGRIIQRKDGTYGRNPLWLMRSNVESMLADLAKQLWLTPNARLRAAIEHEREQQDHDPQRPTAIDEYKKRLAE